VRPGAPPGPLRLERVEGSSFVWESPSWAVKVPDDADLVLVCVRYEQLDADLVRLLEAGPKVAIVVLTPMLPTDLARLSERLPIVAAMPGVVAYFSEPGVLRYWLPRLALTCIDVAHVHAGAIDVLVDSLNDAGIRAAVVEGTRTTNPSTTLSFVPLTMALDVAGGVDALLNDRDLLKLACDAVQEGRTLASRIGNVQPWAGLLLRFVTPTTVRAGVMLARARSAEAVRYVEHHFGRKLHAQNVAMAAGMLDLAARHGTDHDALAQLARQLNKA
ncbi:MAG: hypothetical protein WCI05_19175, partial [Myxococcales bacterium]